METIIFILAFFIIQILMEKSSLLARLSMKGLFLGGIPISILVIIVSGILVNRIMLILFFAVFGSMIVATMRKSKMLQVK